MSNNILKQMAFKIPIIGKPLKERSEFKANACFPAGHYYSTIASVEDVKSRQDEIWKNVSIDGVDGIDLKSADQLSLIRNFEKFYSDLPFKDNKQDNYRYYYNNGYYSYTDAITLYAMMRHYQPKKIIEVGSGFSSAAMLDTNEIFFDNQIHLTFIEPYNDRLLSLLKDSDKHSTSIIKDGVQEISTKVFEQLNAGDFLFIDSTHVSKTGSDVNYLLFDVLPKLKPGVIIHFHDIFYPFEYPKYWVFEGRNWNEDYILRSFLMYNKEFEIKLFSDYLHKHHSDTFANMPLCYKNFGGNLWIERK